MKICFVWVEKYRNFSNMGFNLSSKTKFKYDNLSNVLSIEKEVKDQPENFFGENITDIMGIIGKNGAGKSNAVDLVCKILKSAKTAILKSNFLVVIEENQKFICKYYFPNTEEPKTNSSSIIFQLYDGNINPLKVIFFSNVFDERKNNFSSEIADISVNNLYRRHGSDFEKQIKLIESKIFQSLDIEVPGKILFTSKVWRHNMNSLMNKYTYNDDYKILNEFKVFLRERLRKIHTNNKFVYLIIYGFFIKSLVSILRQNNEDDSINKFISELFTLRTDDIMEKLINYIEKHVDQFGNEDFIYNKNENNERLKYKYEQINFLRELKNSLTNIYIDHDMEGYKDNSLEYFVFEYDSKNKMFLNKMIYLFEDSKIFDINWLGISSGHKAYLNLFSSLFEELRYSKQENLLLCIDEGDLYLHPKWQVEFFNKLLNVLSNIYFGKVQLVLTSHSPFLLSDLPNSNITILEDGKSTNGIDLKINTFGGNLYDLYSEPFFLDKKRTSEFAWNKIQQLINDVNTNNLTPERKIELLKINNILGDEIIKYKIDKELKND